MHYNFLVITNEENTLENQLDYFYYENHDHCTSECDKCKGCGNEGLWDWYEIGGRWKNSLHACNYQLDNEHEENWVNKAKISDLTDNEIDCYGFIHNGIAYIPDTKFTREFRKGSKLVHCDVKEKLKELLAELDKDLIIVSVDLHN